MAKQENLTKTVFEWDHFSAYLSGPIDFGRETAANWRRDLTERLVSIGFKPGQIFDPCKKPLGNAPFNLDDESEIMEKHRSRREWKELMNVMGQIVHIDLRLVDKSDLIIVNLPKYGQDFFTGPVDKFMKGYQPLLDFYGTLGADRPKGLPHISNLQTMYKAFMELLGEAAGHRIPTYGTLHEIVVAHLQQKPIYVVWEGGKDTCSAWLMYLVGHRKVFSTMDELVTRLDNIAKGRTAYSAKEWLLLDLSDRDAESERDAAEAEAKSTETKPEETTPE